jgi:hypothetical protein
VRDDLDNVVDLATRRSPSDSGAAVVHTIVCLALQREIYESKISHLKRMNRALILISLTAYILGMYLGCATALHLFDAP